MSGVQVRKIDLDDEHDVNEVVALHRLAFTPDEAEVHRPESGHWWLVMLNGMSVAFAGYVDGITNPAFGYMIRAGVIPEARGRGLQRKLLRVREHHAAATVIVAWSPTQPIISRLPTT
jgi:ribosomal protein S18 acetylase RimI-like enzyme